MALDGLLLHTITNQLQDYCPGKIGKIQNVSDEEILLHIHHSQLRNQKLILNVHSNTNRIFITNQSQTIQQSPSNFVMVLRKNLSQGMVTSIEQMGYDRILCISITNRNEFSDLVQLKLYVELMGKYANIVLVNEQNIIIDALKRIPVYENSKRTIHPGAMYTLPDPGNKMNPTNVSNLDMDSSFVQQIYGFSPILSNEFQYRIKQGMNYNDILNECFQSNTLYVYQKDYHCIELTHLHQQAQTYPLMIGLDQLYKENEQKIRIKEQCGDVIRTVDKELNKSLKKLPKLEKSLQDSKDYKKYQEYGDLLFAYMYDTKKEKEVILPSFETNEEIHIPIDMRYDLKDNANKYYQKYHKLKRSQSILKQQIEQCKEDIEYFTQLKEQLTHCQIDDALEIREELMNQRILFQKNQNIRRKKNKKPNVLHLHYLDSDIYIGKNNIQNNYITHQLSRKQDIWFHVKDYHGSHVLLKTENINEELIRMCANLAAYHSKGKQSSSVPVDYCPISQIKKVPGSKIGFVTMKSYKTIYIDPDPVQIEQWIEQYKKNS